MLFLRVKEFIKYRINHFKYRRSRRSHTRLLTLFWRVRVPFWKIESRRCITYLKLGWWFQVALVLLMTRLGMS